MRQAGEAGSEVVDGDMDAQLAQLRYGRSCASCVGTPLTAFEQSTPFRQLDLQQTRLESIRLGTLTQQLGKVGAP